MVEDVLYYENLVPLLEYSWWFGGIIEVWNKYGHINYDKKYVEILPVEENN